MAEISRICCFYTYQENSCTSMYIYIMQPELLKIILLVFRRFFYSVLPLTLPTKMFNSVHSCMYIVYTLVQGKKYTYCCPYGVWPRIQAKVMVFGLTPPPPHAGSERPAAGSVYSQ